jgi:hypothetical protein
MRNVIPSEARDLHFEVQIPLSLCSLGMTHRLTALGMTE